MLSLRHAQVLRPSAIAAMVAAALLTPGCGGGDAAGQHAAQAAGSTRSHARSLVRVADGTSQAYTLQTLPQTRDFVTNAVVATPSCRLGFLPPTELASTVPVAAPTDGGGVTFSPSQLATWRDRVNTGPFVIAGDYVRGSPGDWTRISSNASYFILNGEVPVTAAMSGYDLFRSGSYARDAAFHFLLKRDPIHLAAVRQYLLSTVANGEADLTTSTCYRYYDGRSVPDAPFTQGGWMLRMAVTYDYVRADLSDADRVAIENFLRRNAYWLAANLDWAIQSIFPRRQFGDYGFRIGDAAAQSLDAASLKMRRDSNDDCVIDAQDDPRSFTAHTHVNADGSLGSPITLVSQRFNNRRSTQAAAVAALGAVLADRDLMLSAERYFMEWLSYAVYADGSEGEYARNGDYCVPKMGVAYSQANVQGAMLLVNLQNRSGPSSLLAYASQDGLWGTQGSSEQKKSLRLVVKNHLDMTTLVSNRYLHEPWKTVQTPRTQTHLGRLDSHYNNATKATDNFQELGLLLSAWAFPDLPVQGVVMRDPSVTTLRFPSANGNSLSTGAVPWLDQMGAFPAVYLLR